MRWFRPKADGRAERRGATLILVSLLMVPLVTVAAYSLDVGWWQVGATQLQTTADAAALAAARAKQLYPTQNTQLKVEEYARGVAAANLAFGQPITLASSDIEPVFWTPATRSVTSSNWNDANAVRVTARATPGLMFAGVVRRTAPTIARSSVAWIANVNSTDCIRPWSLPYEILYDKVTALTGIASTASSPGGGQRPDLSQEQMAALTLGDYSERSRTVVLYGPNTPSTLPPGALGTTGYDGQWIGFNFAGNAGNFSYQGNIYGCDPNPASVTEDNGTTLPGVSTDYECWTVRALMGSTGNVCNPGWTTATPTKPVTCHYRSAVTTGIGNLALTRNDAGCYASDAAAQPGMVQRVSWGDLTGVGANAVDHRVVGTVKLLCVFRGLGTGSSSQGGSGQGNQTGGGGVSIETCTPAGALVPLTNLPRGTIVIAIEGLSTLTLSPNTELGNTVSTNQRLILVR